MSFVLPAYTKPQFPDYAQNAQTNSVAHDAEVAAAQAAAEAAQQALAAQQAADAAYAQQQAMSQNNVSGNSYELFIFNHESGNNPGAINSSSGACGLGQALPCSKLPCSLSDYACQEQWFTGYAIGSYGSWYNAYLFWTAHSWW